MRFRTDRHNNPTAFTTDVAKAAKLVQGVDYEQGDPFKAGGRTYYTARLLGEPIAITSRVIDQISFTTKAGARRWTYIEMPAFVWAMLTPEQRRYVIGWMYKHEGGTELRGLFT